MDLVLYSDFFYYPKSSFRLILGLVLLLEEPRLVLLSSLPVPLTTLRASGSLPLACLSLEFPVRISYP